MDELIKILSINNSDIEQYVNNRINFLNSLSNDINEVSLGEDTGEIYKGWISTNTDYLPSGNRSKGFKLTKQFYIDFCQDIKEKFGRFDTNVIKSKFSSDKLIQWINMYTIGYFGEGNLDDDLRKKIYGYR